MQKLIDHLIDFFNEEEWEFAAGEGRTLLKLGYSGENGTYICYAQSREEQGQVIFYTICPVTTPEKRRSAVAEFVTRANYGLIIGNFEMDLDDGEVRFKTSLDAEDAELSRVLIRHLVYANITTIDRYLPGLIAVIAGSQTPLEALKAVEGASSPDLSKS